MAEKKPTEKKWYWYPRSPNIPYNLNHLCPPLRPGEIRKDTDCSSIIGRVFEHCELLLNWTFWQEIQFVEITGRKRCWFKLHKLWLIGEINKNNTDYVPII
jgi:hypothetical protein